ncbi:hypothetical protein BDB01DRAFT_780176 [Pilobolus umbonatus]|nr:hypothetical protein BDB01DRAFT_780176 [Pilobolus umbonatus]
MKSILVLIILYTLIQYCQTTCICDPYDTVCINNCVLQANTCVTDCRGNIKCYENCIDDKW